MDGHDHTANVSTFHQLYAACEQILFLRFDKKHRRYLYCVILWSKLQICSQYCFVLTSYTARFAVTSTSLPSVTIAIRCCQFGNSLKFEEMSRTAEKLWNDYILQVHTCYHYATANVKLSLLHYFCFRRNRLLS